MMMKTILRLIITLFLVQLGNSTLLAQGRFSNIIYDNYTYVENIRSVQFYIDGFPLDDPIISIDDENPLTLLFDDFSENVENYFYTIIHCDMDWQPSNLNEMEYIDGFIEERMNDFAFSEQTLINYTNYFVNIPNRNMRFTKTGNYLLVVYKKDRDPIPVITRRFVVYDPKLFIEARLVRPIDIDKIRTHQEIDFKVFKNPKFRIGNPKQEIRATILQNGRWDNAIMGLQPFFIRPQEMIYDYQDKIVFPGGKEFRFLDIRSLRQRNFNIAEIIRRNDGHDVFLKSDLSRVSQAYININDANGKFAIENQDRGDSFLSADYVDVIFSYKTDQAYTDQDIYLLGGFNDWRLEENYRMVFNPRVNAYVLKVPLKQGYYNYQYALVPRDGEARSVDISETEGNWHEAENDYTILIYYRPFGARYDQVIGHIKINSLD